MALLHFQLEVLEEVRECSSDVWLSLAAHACGAEALLGSALTLAVLLGSAAVCPPPEARALPSTCHVHAENGPTSMSGNQNIAAYGVPPEDWGIAHLSIVVVGASGGP